MTELYQVFYIYNDGMEIENCIPAPNIEEAIKLAGFIIEMLSACKENEEDMVKEIIFYNWKINAPFCIVTKDNVEWFKDVPIIEARMEEDV